MVGRMYLLSLGMTVLLRFAAGLDATSSLELLNHLNLVAETGRLVLLTIHQPRLEIFHLFHKILFLCEGKVMPALKRTTIGRKTDDILDRIRS